MNSSDFDPHLQLADVPGVPMPSINVPSTQSHRIQRIGSHLKQESC